MHGGGVVERRRGRSGSHLPRRSVSCWKGGGVLGTAAMLMCVLPRFITERRKERLCSGHRRFLTRAHRSLPLCVPQTRPPARRNHPGPLPSPPRRLPPNGCTPAKPTQPRQWLTSPTGPKQHQQRCVDAADIIRGLQRWCWDREYPCCCCGLATPGEGEIRDQNMETEQRLLRVLHGSSFLSANSFAHNSTDLHGKVTGR